MKKLIFLFFLSSNLYGQDIPGYLEGATYTITLKNGKKHTFSSEEMKLVKRKQEKPKPKPPKVIEKIKEVIVKEPTPTYKPFSIGVAVGLGPTNLKIDEKSDAAEVKVRQGIIGGLSLGYQLNPAWQFRGEVLTNKTLLLGAEWKFGPNKS